MSIELKPAPTERRRVVGCGRPSPRQILWAIVFFVSQGAGFVVLRRLPSLRYLIAVFPLFAGALYIHAMVSDIRRQMDELQLRIYLEAAAVVVCGLFIAMMAYPLLQAVGLVPPLNYRIVLALIFGLGLVGYFAARRRYR